MKSTSRSIESCLLSLKEKSKIKRFYHDFKALLCTTYVYIVQCTTQPQNELEEKWRDLLPQHVKNKPQRPLLCGRLHEPRRDDGVVLHIFFQKQIRQHLPPAMRWWSKKLQKVELWEG